MTAKQLRRSEGEMIETAVSINREEIKAAMKEKGLTTAKLATMLGYEGERSLYRALASGKMSTIVAARLNSILYGVNRCPVCGAEIRS